jgi:hypothetical protein
LEDAHTLDRLMEASAASLDLTLPEASRAAIRRDLAFVLSQARICEESLGTPLPAIAPVFRP